jgi:hypothetical protein
VNNNKTCQQELVKYPINKLCGITPTDINEIKLCKMDTCLVDT